MFKFLSVLTYICGVIAMLILMGGISDASIAMALVLIPCCVTAVFYMAEHREISADVRRYSIHIKNLIEGSTIVENTKRND